MKELPFYAKLRILLHLEVDDIIVCRRISASFYEAVCYPDLWNALCNRDAFVEENDFAATTATATANYGSSNTNPSTLLSSSPAAAAASPNGNSSDSDNSEEVSAEQRRLSSQFKMATSDGDGGVRRAPFRPSMQRLDALVQLLMREEERLCVVSGPPILPHVWFCPGRARYAVALLARHMPHLAFAVCCAPKLLEGASKKKKKKNVQGGGGGGDEEQEGKEKGDVVASEANDDSVLLYRLPESSSSSDRFSMKLIMRCFNKDFMRAEKAFYLFLQTLVTMQRPHHSLHRQTRNHPVTLQPHDEYRGVVGSTSSSSSSRARLQAERDPMTALMFASVFGNGSSRSVDAVAESLGKTTTTAGGSKADDGDDDDGGGDKKQEGKEGDGGDGDVAERCPRCNAQENKKRLELDDCRPPPLVAPAPCNRTLLLDAAAMCVAVLFPRSDEADSSVVCGFSLLGAVLTMLWVAGYSFFFQLVEWCVYEVFLNVFSWVGDIISFVMWSIARFDLHDLSALLLHAGRDSCWFFWSGIIHRNSSAVAQIITTAAAAMNLTYASQLSSSTNNNNITMHVSSSEKTDITLLHRALFGEPPGEMLLEGIDGAVGAGAVVGGGGGPTLFLGYALLAVVVLSLIADRFIVKSLMFPGYPVVWRRSSSSSASSSSSSLSSFFWNRRGGGGRAAKNADDHDGVDQLMSWGSDARFKAAAEQFVMSFLQAMTDFASLVFTGPVLDHLFCSLWASRVSCVWSVALFAAVAAGTYINTGGAGGQSFSVGSFFGSLLVVLLLTIYFSCDTLLLALAKVIVLDYRSLWFSLFGGGGGGGGDGDASDAWVNYKIATKHHHVVYTASHLGCVPASVLDMSCIFGNASSDPFFCCWGQQQQLHDNVSDGCGWIR